MTRIGGRNAGEEVAAHFAHALKRVNPKDPVVSAQEFHAAQESVRGRERDEAKAASQIQKSAGAIESGSPSMSTEDFIRANIMWQMSQNSDRKP